jgi:hypothetical protein
MNEDIDHSPVSEREIDDERCEEDRERETNQLISFLNSSRTRNPEEGSRGKVNVIKKEFFFILSRGKMSLCWVRYSKGRGT